MEEEAASANGAGAALKRATVGRTSGEQGRGGPRARASVNSASAPSISSALSAARKAAGSGENQATSCTYGELREYLDSRLRRLEQSTREISERQTADILKAVALAASEGRAAGAAGTAAETQAAGTTYFSWFGVASAPAGPSAAPNGSAEAERTPPASPQASADDGGRGNFNRNVSWGGPNDPSKMTALAKEQADEAMSYAGASFSVREMRRDADRDSSDHSATSETSPEPVSPRSENESRTTRQVSVRRTLKKQPTVLSWVNDNSRDMTPRGRFGKHSWLACIPGSEEIIQWFQWLAVESQQEPPRSGPVHAFVRSRHFSFLCQLVILLNTGFVFVDTNYQIDNMQEQAMPISSALETFFGVFYCVELALRLYSHGRWFFIGSEASWNWFDTSLVVVTVMDLMGSLSGNVSFARALRVLKVIKVLRIVRVLQFFSELRLMINCVLGSIVSLFWCVVMICFVMFLFAVYFTQAVTLYMKEDWDGPDHVEVSDYPEIKKYFGNVHTSILTLFMAVTGGVDWQLVYNVLQPVGDIACTAFLAYIFVFLFSIWNVIMSVFVEKGVKMAEPDANAVIVEARRKQAADAKELKSLFAEAGFDSHTNISQTEFEEFVSKPEFKEFLQSRGIDIKEAHTFFNMVAETIGDKELEVNSVVRCCLGIKGYATSIDLHILRYEVREAMRMVEDLWIRLCPDQGGSFRNSRRNSWENPFDLTI